MVNQSPGLSVSGYGRTPLGSGAPGPPPPLMDEGRLAEAIQGSRSCHPGPKDILWGDFFSPCLLLNPHLPAPPTPTPVTSLYAPHLPLSPSNWKAPKAVLFGVSPPPAPPPLIS